MTLALNKSSRSLMTLYALHQVLISFSWITCSTNHACADSNFFRNVLPTEDGIQLVKLIFVFISIYFSFVARVTAVLPVTSSELQVLYVIKNKNSFSIPSVAEFLIACCSSIPSSSPVSPIFFHFTWSSHDFMLSIRTTLFVWLYAIKSSSVCYISSLASSGRRTIRKFFCATFMAVLLMIFGIQYCARLSTSLSLLPT